MSESRLWAGKPPCQNNMCPMWFKGSPENFNYTQCKDTFVCCGEEAWPHRCIIEGGVYRDTPPPEPWEPLNPDDYEIGCKDFTPSRVKCHVCNAPNNLMDCEFHAYLCECVPCYRPKKKQKFIEYAVIKVPVDAPVTIGISDCEALNLRAPRQINTDELSIKYGITCEIVKEPVK